MNRLRLLRRAFAFAWEGLAWAWHHQTNLRIECFIGTGALVLTLWLGADLAPILLVSGLVLTLELLNTAVEAAVDLATPDLHPLAKRAKDVAAAAVLLAAIIAVFVGLDIIGPPLLDRLGG